jgi:hypothetical protein
MRATHSFNYTADRFVGYYDLEISDHPISKRRIGKIPEIENVLYVDIVAAKRARLSRVFREQISSSAANHTKPKYGDVGHFFVSFLFKKGCAFRAPR